VGGLPPTIILSIRKFKKTPTKMHSPRQASAVLDGDTSDVNEFFTFHDELRDQRAVALNRLLQQQVYMLTKDYTLEQMEEVQKILSHNVPKVVDIDKQLQQRTKATIKSLSPTRNDFHIRHKKRKEEIETANLAIFHRLEKVRSLFEHERSRERVRHVPRINPNSRLLKTG
jgi:hypothetical protein